MLLSYQGGVGGGGVGQVTSGGHVTTGGHVMGGETGGHVHH